MTLWGTLVAATYVLALISIPSVLLKRQGRPQAALGWVLVLFSLPVLGLLLWWAIGRRHLVRRRRKKQRATKQLAQRINTLQNDDGSTPTRAWEILPIRHLPPEDAEWVYPPTRNNQVQLLVDAEQAYPAMERLIREARHHIHLLFYIWNADATGRRFRDLLIERARAGIQVRVLYDAIGSSGIRRRFMDDLRSAGGEAVAFMPPRILRRRRLELNFRNHRKLVLADGRAAVVGGLNLGDEYTQHWRDTAIELEGPTVDQLQELFADDWYFATKRDFLTADHFGGWREACSTQDTVDVGLVASGPHTTYNFTHEAFFIAINGAQQRIWLTTPYFVPSETIMAAFHSAAIRGVDVRLLVPLRGDQRLVDLASRSYYPELLRAGVRIFQYQPGILHSKTAIFDDHLVSVGSANVDIRSFRLNFEVGCFIKSDAFCQQLSNLFEIDMAKSRELMHDDLARSSTLTRLTESVAHLLSPLL